MKIFEFNLGSEVKDKITGFKGIVSARAEHLTGCNRYGVQSQKLDEKGHPIEWQWFDEQQLVLLKDKKIPLEHLNKPLTEGSVKNTTKPGGPLRKDQMSNRGL